MFAFYLFVVSFFGLLTFYISAMTGVGGLTHVFAGTGYSWQLESAVRSLSWASVSALLWWAHWRMLSDEHTRDKENLRFLQAFLASGLLVLGLFVYGSEFVTAGANLGLGLGEAQHWHLLAAAVNLSITLGLWLHHVRSFRRQDGKRRLAEAEKAEAAAS